MPALYSLYLEVTAQSFIQLINALKLLLGRELGLVSGLILKVDYFLVRVK